MNKALMKARRDFRKQKGTIKSGYDNTPFPEGTYVVKVAKASVEESTIKEVLRPTFNTRLVVELGEHKGKSMFPFRPCLDDVDGVIQAARNIRSILGDVIPGKVLPGGEFEVDLSDFLEQVEDLAERLNGEMVEVSVKNSKKQKEDGTYWQNIYINRGLGADAKAIVEGNKSKDTRKSVKDDDDLDYSMKGGKKKATPKKKTAKKRVARKKK